MMQIEVDRVHLVKQVAMEHEAGMPGNGPLPGPPPVPEVDPKAKPGKDAPPEPEVWAPHVSKTISGVFESAEMKDMKAQAADAAAGGKPAKETKGKKANGEVAEEPFLPLETEPYP